MSEPSAERSCFILAIDGPAGAGKSTTARALSRELDFSYLDSGALYRCVGLAALEADVPLDDGPALARMIAGLDVGSGDGGTKILLNGKDVSAEIRTSRISDAASRTSALPEVREALVALQRNAARGPGLVIEGRDIGTVIFPAADLKVFLHADPDERARRRAAESGGGANVANVGREMAARDRRDSARKVAPLVPADDAMLIDSTELDFDAVVSAILAEVKRRRIA